MGKTVGKGVEKMSIVSNLHVKGKDLIAEAPRGGDGVAINMRLPRGLVNSIDEWVEDEMFRSRSDFILSATRHYLYFLADKGHNSSGKREERIDKR